MAGLELRLLMADLSKKGHPRGFLYGLAFFASILLPFLSTALAETCDSLLGKSLIPLASELETAKSPEEMRSKLTDFEQALNGQGRTDYHIDLYDEERYLIASSFGWKSDPPGCTTFDVNVPIYSPWVPSHMCRMFFNEDWACVDRQ